MNKIKTIIKLSVILTLLTITHIEYREFIGLYFLIIGFGIVLLWSTLHFFRYAFFFLLSALLLIPAAWLLHSHFYNWQNVARKNVVVQIANMIENVYLLSSDDMLPKIMEIFSLQTELSYEKYIVDIKDKNGITIFKTSMNEPETGSNMVAPVTSKGGHVNILHIRKIRSYWGWNGTYVGYWRALSKLEVIFYNPPKYTDILLMHIIMLLLVVSSYLQYNFVLNYRQSGELLEKFHSIINDKKKE